MLRCLRPLACLTAAVFGCIGFAENTPRWYLSGFVGRGLTVLGSQDPRRVGGFGVACELGDSRRLRWGPHQGTLVLEGYYDLSSSPGVKRTPPNSTQAWGTLAFARFRWRKPGAPTAFVDIGWGLQYASQSTRDLSSKLNSTPVIDFGVVIGRQHPGALVGVRWLHISNAGLVRKNKGQNELLLLVQVPL